MSVNVNYFKSQSKGYDRKAEHGQDALELLDYFRRINRDGLPPPSTAELQEMKIFGLRPVNRIGDLTKGRYNRTHYDFEKIRCPHGVYRWRLHEPSRPGYPKNEKQAVLTL